MSIGGTNRFGAAGPALGYLAQVEYALLVALQRMDAEESLRLSLESLDDITFESEGRPHELWQTKHHVGRRGSLGDASPDIWKALHNWIETADGPSACFLFTTATASEGSAASLLRRARTADDVKTAREKLDSVANAGGNVASADYYSKYLGLTDDQRLSLLNRVTGSAARIGDNRSA